MSVRVLVTYATRYGSTAEVAEAVAATLREDFSLDAELQPMRSVRSLEGYCAVVLGMPLYVGSWPNEADRFLLRHHTALTRKRIAIFALGPVSHDAEEQRASREQLERELGHYPWLTPVAVQLFAGKFDPAALRFPDNLLTTLPASPLHDQTGGDLRDWEAIRAWAHALVAELQLVSTH
jgi:menaquinone-dependent protoporphyrinogen oxidase